MGGFVPPPDDKVTRLGAWGQFLPDAHVEGGAASAFVVPGEYAAVGPPPAVQLIPCLSVPPPPPAPNASDEDRARYAQKLAEWKVEEAARSQKKADKAQALQFSAVVQLQPCHAFVSKEEAAALDAAAGFTPSEDQVIAMQALLTAFQQRGIYQLRGAAGSGKTAVIRALLRRIPPSWEVALLAPTWAAANRLSALVGTRAISLHRYLYGKPEEVRQCPACKEWSNALVKPVAVEVEEKVNGEMLKVKRPRYVCPGCQDIYVKSSTFPSKLIFPVRDMERPPVPRLVVLDEASMISKTTLHDIETYIVDPYTRVVLVGDPNQIPPVSSTDAPEEEIDFSTPTAMLDRIHRQAEGNPVLLLAHQHKTHPKPEKLPEWPFPRQWRGDPRVRIESGGVNAIAHWHARLRSEGQSVVSIAMTNQVRAEINALVRSLLNLTALSAEQNAPLAPGDRILLRSNPRSGDVFNGEMHIVCSLTRVSPGTRMLNAASRSEWAKRGTMDALDVNAVLDFRDIGVWQIETWPIHEVPGERRRGYIVAAWLNGKWALESDYLLAEDPNGRKTAQDIVQKWKQEYNDGIDSLENQWKQELGLVANRDAALKGLTRDNLLDGVVKHLIETITQDVPTLQKAAAQAEARALYDQGDITAIAERFDNPHLRYCVEVETVEEYADRRYQAIPTERVWQIDYGECATGHSMQGSQAANIGVAYNSTLFGKWKHARVEAMRWLYTAMTRTTNNLVLFRFPYVATG